MKFKEFGGLRDKKYSSCVKGDNSYCIRWKKFWKFQKVAEEMVCILDERT